MVTPFAHWFVFAVVLFLLLFIDLWLQRNDHGSNRKEAIVWSVIWVGVGLAFSIYVNFALGADARNQYLSTYLIEKSLSVDNLFVFLLIFSAMKIPLRFQRTALAWGIFGALVFRGIFIYLGTTILERWAGLGILFALFLFYAGIKACFVSEDESEESKIVSWLSKHLPVSTEANTSHFFVRENGALKITPILVTIIALELTDVAFAVDSIPAALSFSSSAFIVYSSNAFAILGLRALYVLLASLISHLRYLHFGLCGVLVFAGLKMVGHACETLLDPLKNPVSEAGQITNMCRHLPFYEYFNLDSFTSILLIVFFIGTAALASVIFKEKKAK